MKEKKTTLTRCAHLHIGDVSTHPQHVHMSPNMPRIQEPFDFQQYWLVVSVRIRAWREVAAPLRRPSHQLPLRVTPDVSWQGCLGMESWQVLMNQKM